MFVCEGETKQQQLAGVHWTHSDGSERQGELSERRIIFIYYFVLCIFNRKLGLPFLCMAAAAARAVLTIPTYMCSIFMHPNNAMHSCPPLLGVNLSPEFVNLYFPYAGQGLLFFRWWQRHFEFHLACVAVEGRSNVVQSTCVRLQISLPTRFLSLLHLASQCAFGDGMCRLLVRHFFSLFAPKLQNLVKVMFSCIHFSIWPYPPKIMKKWYFIPVNCMG